MTTGPSADLQDFHRFLGQQLDAGATVSPEEALSDFRERQRQLDLLRAKLQVALDESARGESAPLDVEAVKRDVRAQLASEGIYD
jgi:hypothetical protein